MTDADAERLRRSLLVERLVEAGSLADGLAHEVRNPFNVVRLQLAVLQRRLEQPDCQPASLQPVLDLVDAALSRLEVLFDDFIVLLQPPSGAGTVLAPGEPCSGTMTLVRTDDGKVILKADPDPTT
jgi:signal transduction histidine kinase